MEFWERLKLGTVLGTVFSTVLGMFFFIMWAGHLLVENADLQEELAAQEGLVVTLKETVANDNELIGVLKSLIATQEANAERDAQLIALLRETVMIHEDHIRILRGQLTESEEVAARLDAAHAEEIAGRDKVISLQGQIIKLDNELIDLQDRKIARAVLVIGLLETVSMDRQELTEYFQERLEDCEMNRHPFRKRLRRPAPEEEMRPTFDVTLVATSCAW